MAAIGKYRHTADNKKAAEAAWWKPVVIVVWVQWRLVTKTTARFSFHGAGCARLTIGIARAAPGVFTGAARRRPECAHRRIPLNR